MTIIQGLDVFFTKLLSVLAYTDCYFLSFGNGFVK